MKSHKGILWYFFVVYITTVIVNFNSKSQLTSSLHASQASVSVLRCALSTNNSKNWNKQCKPVLRDAQKKITVMFQSLIQSPILRPYLKLDKNDFSKAKSKSSKKQYTSPLEQWIQKLVLMDNQAMMPLLCFLFFSWASMIVIILLPFWHSGTHVYYITIAAIALCGTFFSLRAVKLLLHMLIRSVTFGKCHFWLFPNLSEDVGLFQSFYPIMSLQTIQSESKMVEKLNENNLKEIEKPILIEREIQTELEPELKVKDECVDELNWMSTKSEPAILEPINLGTNQSLMRSIKEEKLIRDEQLIKEEQMLKKKHLLKEENLLKQENLSQKPRQFKPFIMKEAKKEDDFEILNVSDLIS